jgi:hypothetical protein
MHGKQRLLHKILDDGMTGPEPPGVVPAEAVAEIGQQLTIRLLVA